jgi:phenylacetate-CoA ligase
MQTELKSIVAGHQWPTILDQGGSQMLAILYQLEESQWWQPEILLKHQFRQLNEVWRHAFASVPFYNTAFKRAGFKEGAGIEPGQWSDLPILGRRILQQNEKSLMSRKIPRSHGKTNLVTTSGSTGLPVRVVGTQVTALFWKVLTLREHLWHRRDFSGKLAAIRHAAKGVAEYPGSRSGGWGPATSPVVTTGPAVLLNSSTDISKQAEWLLNEEPDYLLTYPSNLQALAAYFLKNGLSLSNLKEVRTLGEALGSEVRSLCRQAWNVSLADMYSAQEVGYIALQCPDNAENYHVQSESQFLEVVDDEGNPCSEGQAGKVLLTSLHNFAMPLIRYEVGDYAEVGPPCSCGRGLPVLSQIMGRKRNMLVLPNGEKSWPGIGLATGRGDLPYEQFQVVQKSVNHIEARLVTERQFTPAEEKRFTGILQEALGYPFSVEIVYLESIPRSKGGKFEDFVSEVA